jgi:hypothetical protein
MKPYLITIGFLLSAFNISGQENDHCRNAALLTPGPACVITEFRDGDATDDPTTVAPDPTCGSYTGGDVWFKVVVPATGALCVKVDRPNSSVVPSFTVYSGTCGDFEELVCVRNDARKTITVPELAGEIIFIRIYSYFGISAGSATICVFEPSVPINNNCQDAMPLSVRAVCELQEYSNAFATEEPGLVQPGSCGHYTGGDIWYKTQVPATGTMWVSKNRIGGTTNPAMAVYAGECNALTEIFCSDNDPLVRIDLPQYAGEEVHLRIYSYGNEEGAEFSLCLFEDNAPANDNCTDAIPLLVGTSCAPSNYSNAMATTEPPDVAGNPTCGMFQGGDVWFSALVPSSGKLSIKAETPFSSVPPSIVVYSGVCGDLHEIRCANNQILVNISDTRLAGETVLIRVYKYNNGDGGPFSLCLYEPPCETIDHDAGDVRICQGDTFNFGSQKLSDTGTYQENFVTPAGCDSLVTIRLTSVEVKDGIDQQGSDLFAEEDDATYQWKNCDLDQPVEEAHEKMFTPTATGLYSVIITKEGCTVESNCVAFTVVGIESPAKLRVYPNPVINVLNIETPDNKGIDSIQIINANKQIVRTYLGVKSGPIDINDLSAGIYFLKTDRYPAFRLIKK